MIRLVEELPAEQFEWRNDPNVYNTCRQQGPLAQANHDRWMVNRKPDGPDRFWGIEFVSETNVPGFRKKPVIVGTAGLTSIRNDHGTAEWSLLIGPPHQGNGYAKLGLMELLRKGFNELRLNLIWGEIMEHNPKSLHLAEDVGMKVEAKLRSRYWKMGRYVDSYVVSMTLEEWIKIMTSDKQAEG